MVLGLSEIRERLIAMVYVLLIANDAGSGIYGRMHLAGLIILERNGYGSNFTPLDMMSNVRQDEGIRS